MYAKALPVILAALALGAPNAQANQINTGGATGAYQTAFCPQLQDALKTSRFDYSCVASEGSSENIQRVLNNPDQIGFSQFDVFMDQMTLLNGEELFTTLRTDIGRECIFMVTRDPELKTFGDVAARATSLRFVLPPKKSGSTATFEYLQRVDPEGLGLANNVTYAETTDEALERALSANGSVTLFVQFADPDNARFKRIDELKGNFVPVIDRAILREEVNGEKVYYAEETEVSLPKWTRKAEKLVTSCTPIVLFTGKSDRLDDATAQRDHADMIRTVQKLSVEQLQPKQGWLSRIWKQTKAISAVSVDKMIDLSQEAREAAQPYVDQAKDASQPYVDKTKEAYDQAKDASKTALERAREATQKAVERARQAGETAVEKGQELLDKAKEAVDEARTGNSTNN